MSGRTATEVTPMMFGERFRSLLDGHGMSVAEVAQLTGIGVTTLYDYIHNRRVPSAPVIVALSKTLGVEYAALLDCEFAHEGTRPRGKRR